MATIEIHDYRPTWPKEFTGVAAHLAFVLGDVALAIDHVGSTSVANLAAKDVIDVQVTVADLSDARIADAMSSAGYFRHRFLTDVPPPGSGLADEDVPKMTFSEPAGERRVNVHIRREGSPNARYVLLFRDYLRANPVAAAAYAELKRTAASHFADDEDGYYSMKDPFVALAMHSAEAWAADTGWIPDRRSHWERVYTKRSPEEVSWHQDDPARSLALIECVAAGPGAVVLDVGGGASRLVDRLVAAGYENVTVLDISATALEHARRRLGERQHDVRWLEADAASFELGHPVDVWHDRAVFHFLCDPADRDNYVSTMARTVRPGGHGIVATFAEDGPLRCSGLPVRRYSEDELAQALSPAFTPLRFEREAHTTPRGATQHFLYGLFGRT